MIYTITLNPAIDHVFETKFFQPDETIYYQNEYELVGGKGINVAIMLNELDVDVIATGLLGAQNSEVFNEKFKAIKLKEKFFEFDGYTRTNYKIIALDNQKALKFKSEPHVNDLDGVKLLDFLDRNLSQNDLVVVSGSVPRTITPMIYNQIGMITKRNQALFILDSANIWLKKALKSRPFLIKITLNEICELLKLDKKQSYSLSELKTMLLDLEKMGAQNILLSLGSEGSLYFEKSSQTFYKASTVIGKVINLTGSGDSMLAGFIYGMVTNLSVEDSLKYAAACSAATAFNRGLGERKQIDKFFKKITVQSFKE